MKKLLLFLTVIALYGTMQGQDSLFVLKQKPIQGFLDMEIASASLETSVSPAVLPVSLPVHVEFKYHGLYCVTDLAFAYDVTESTFLTGLNISGGWQWRRQSGFGIGLSYLADSKGVFSQMPIYAELRTHYLRSRLTPFTSLTAGYTLPLGRKGITDEGTTEVLKGGVMVGLSIGGRYAFSRNVGFNFYIGYQLQSLRVERTSGYEGDQYNTDYSKMQESIIQNMIKFGLGINF